MTTITPKFPIDIIADGEAMSSHHQDDIVSAIRFNLKNIILTSPGERIMVSDFGVGIYNKLFENMTPSVINEIRSSIISQIDRWAPYVVINDLQVSSNEDNSISVSISYNVPEIDVNDYFDITTSV